MKRLLALITLVTLLMAGFDAIAVSQITSGNGYLGYNLNAYCRIRIGLDPYSSYEVARFTSIAAIDAGRVLDYQEDQESVVSPEAVTIPKVDDAIQGLSDGSYEGMFAYVRIQTTLMTWTNAPYVVVRFRLYNDSTASVPFYLGAIMVPRPGGVYGLETMQYDAPSQTAYFYRTGEPSYWGVRLLNKPTYSVRILDWDTYSPDPDNDVATDSTRYAMTATTGFDPSLTAGPNGGIYQVNAGSVNIASKDSTDLYYAIGYGTDAPGMIHACDSAMARYSSLLVSVPRVSTTLPTENALEQNYPNPFNPETQIHFSLSRAAFTTLKVYNTVGQEVATLVRENLDAGQYAVRFSGKDLPSGVYFYRIEAGDWTATNRMIVVK